MLAIYTRTESGMIEYLGEQDWDSLDQCLEANYRADEQPETVELRGWGHTKITWYGDLGIGED